MTNADQPTFVAPERTWIGFVWLGVAWLVWLLGLARGTWINAQFVGPGEDVTDSLRRVGYIAERLLVFDGAALVAEVASGLVLLGARQTTGWVVLAWLLLVPSVLLHGIVFLVHLVVAG